MDEERRTITLERARQEVSHNRKFQLLSDGEVHWGHPYPGHVERILSRVHLAVWEEGAKTDAGVIVGAREWITDDERTVESFCLERILRVQREHNALVNDIARTRTAWFSWGRRRLSETDIENLTPNRTEIVHTLSGIQMYAQRVLMHELLLTQESDPLILRKLGLRVHKKCRRLLGCLHGLRGNYGIPPRESSQSDYPYPLPTML